MLKNCEWCGKDFDANVSYQIYCGVNCRSDSTKNKNSIKQRDKRVKSRVGQVRNCSTCDKPLSIYNDETFCGSCIGDEKKLNKFIRGMK